MSMKTKMLFYALLAMAIVGAATSCKRVEEPDELLPKPEVTIVKNEVADAPANFVSYTITTKNAAEAYWYLGDAIAGQDYVVEHGTRFTTESVVVEQSLPWNGAKCLWAVAISADGQKVMDGVEIIIGEEPAPGMTFLVDYGVNGIHYSDNRYYDITFYFTNGTEEEPRQLSTFLYFEEETNGVLPEGRYVFGAESLPNMGDNSRVKTLAGDLIAELVSATLDVEHIGNEYHLVLNAEDVDGVIYKVDWTGKIKSLFSENPIYNPGEEPNNRLVHREDSAPEGYFQAPIDSYYLDFDFYGDRVYHRIAMYLYVEPGSGGVIPEGHYAYGDGTLPYISEHSKIIDAAANTVANIVSLTLDVEHIGNKYHIVISAEDTLGYIYEADWEGHFVNCWSDWPIYNPGEAPTE